MTPAAWHVVTGEFPPAPGGVGDYSLQLTQALAASGDTVHVWCPDVPGRRPEPPGVEIHWIAGDWSRASLARIDREMDGTRSPRRLLVQWVPHAFGRRSMNVAFCRWVRRRAVRGDMVDLMVHEPYLAFREGSYRQDAAAAVHRVMVALLLSAARRVWVAIPAWGPRLRPWALGRGLPFCWLPVPSNIPVRRDAAAVNAVRDRVGGSAVFGHFGTYGRDVRRALDEVVPRLLDRHPSSAALLLGRQGESFAAALSRQRPDLRSRIVATGMLDPCVLSTHLQACDVLVQPYSDGASTRRGTLMAALEHGLAVVTTTGHLSEPFWQHSNAVASVAAGDVGAVVDAALALALDAEQRAEMGRRARALYDQHFALRHSVESLRRDLCVPA